MLQFNLENVMAVRDLEVAYLKVSPVDAGGGRLCPETGEVFIRAGVRASLQAQSPAIMSMCQQDSECGRLKVQVIETVDQCFTADFASGLINWSDKCL